MLSSSSLTQVWALLDDARNEALPEQERRAALAHALSLKGNAGNVADIQTDELTGVIDRVEPFRDRTVAELFRGTDGVAVDGHSMAEALRLTRSDLQKRSLLAKVIDKDLPMTERLASIQALMDNPKWSPEVWRINSVTAQQLSQSILPATATRIMDDGRRSRVARPPVHIDDVFRPWQYDFHVRADGKLDLSANW